MIWCRIHEEVYGAIGRISKTEDALGVVSGVKIGLTWELVDFWSFATAVDDYRTRSMTEVRLIWEALA
jgi:hypothetical protein